MKYSVHFLILVVTAVAAFAQTESARISGRVTDLSGAVIVGAECKITNLETNVSIFPRGLLQRTDVFDDCLAPTIDVHPLAIADAVLITGHVD